MVFKSRLKSASQIKEEEKAKQLLTERPEIAPKLPTRTFSRPEGTGPERNIETTGLSEQQAEEVRRKNALEGQTIKRLTKEAEQGAVETKVLEEEARRQNIPVEELPPLEEISPVLPEEKPFGLKELAGGPFKAIGPALELINKIPGKPISSAAQLIDSISGFLPFGTGGKKPPLKLAKAEDTFKAAFNIVESDIEAVRNNQKTLGEAQLDLEQSIISLNAIQATQRGIGKLNLNYWVDEGLNVETEIALRLEELEDKRLELNVAAAEARINKARGTFRQPAQ